jgi:hypothetical protein
MNVTCANILIRQLQDRIKDLQDRQWVCFDMARCDLISSLKLRIKYIQEQVQQ